jgi:hypothetical protein
MNKPKYTEEQLRHERLKSRLLGVLDGFDAAQPAAPSAGAAPASEPRCAYPLDGGPCNARIRVDKKSPTGWDHAEGHGWLHFPPAPAVPQEPEAERIVVKHFPEGFWVDGLLLSTCRTNCVAAIKDYAASSSARVEELDRIETVLRGYVSDRDDEGNPRSVSERVAGIKSNAISIEVTLKNRLASLRAAEAQITLARETARKWKLWTSGEEQLADDDTELVKLLDREFAALLDKLKPAADQLHAKESKGE